MSSRRTGCLHTVGLEGAAGLLERREQSPEDQDDGAVLAEPRKLWLSASAQVYEEG